MNTNLFQRYMEISYRELDGEDLSMVQGFLLQCYKRFKHYFPRQRGDNLILLWQSDFDKLLKDANYKGED